MRDAAGQASSRDAQPRCSSAVADKFRILSETARTARYCPLLQDQSDREAWVACCTRRFLPLARRIAANNQVAEDILQESWIRVLMHVCEYRGSPPACGWVHSIVHNCAQDSNSQSSPRAKELDTNLRDPSLDPEAIASERELLQLIRAIIDSLPAAFRDVLEMRYGQGLSSAETAHNLGVSASNVTTRLNRAVKLLKQRLDARLNL